MKGLRLPAATDNTDRPTMTLARVAVLTFAVAAALPSVALAPVSYTHLTLPTILRV